MLTVRVLEVEDLTDDLLIDPLNPLRPKHPPNNRGIGLCVTTPPEYVSYRLLVTVALEQIVEGQHEWDFDVSSRSLNRQRQLTLSVGLYQVCKPVEEGAVACQACSSRCLVPRQLVGLFSVVVSEQGRYRETVQVAGFDY